MPSSKREGHEFIRAVQSLKIRFALRRLMCALSTFQQPTDASVKLLALSCWHFQI